ncbi:MAG TPA: YjfB family protein [Cerasibacillus sp.]|uniref:YjfB family protein n=1 Tax=Cerasibacillus sp. TaxID=2498711 RepID=UPI002F427CAC
MDIAVLSTVMKQAQVKQQASLSVMKSALSTEETNAAGLLKMMQDSTQQQVAHPFLGKQMDVKA